MAKENEAPIKRDLVGSLIIGVAAALLSIIVVANLGIPIPLWSTFLIFPPMTVAGIYVGRFLGKRIPVMYKFVKFGEAGGLNWLVDFGVLNLLIMFTEISTGIWYSIFKGISFIVSATNSYFWNKLWVFESRNKDAAGEISKFAIATVLGVGVNVTIAALIVWIGPSMYNLNSVVWANIAAAAGSIIAMLWNFILYKIWVFKK